MKKVKFPYEINLVDPATNKELLEDFSGKFRIFIFVIFESKEIVKNYNKIEF